MTHGAAGAAVLLLASTVLAAQVARPVERTPPAQANYMLNCMGCHVADGSGAAGKVPSLRDSLVPLSTSAAGRRYLVQVPGASQSALSNLELAQVLNWMVRNLSAQPVPRQFVDFTVCEIARYRGTPLVDVRATRARLLAARSGATTQHSPPGRSCTP
jgi:mono/diheme cytochrome c family protein